MLPDLILGAGLITILCLAIYHDLRSLRLPDGLSLALLALFPLQMLHLGGWHPILMQIALAATVFAVLLTGFAFRLLGGGDVKLLSALALFVPIPLLAHTFLAFSAALVLAIALVLTARALWRGTNSRWQFLTTRKLPMGLAIGMAGLFVSFAQATGGLG